MSYDALETSRFSGLPFELYAFAMGTQTWYLTSGDIARTYAGKTYTPESLVSTEIDQNQELRSGSITITIPRTHEIAGLFISFSPPAPLSLVIYRGHDGEGDSGVVTYFVGRVSTGTFQEHCQLTCVPEQDALKRSIPVQVYQTQCNWALYGPGCGLNKDDFVDSGLTVTAISGDTVTIFGLNAKANGYFQAGWVQLGDLRRMILTHTGNVVQLITPMVGLTVGATVDVYPGCQLDANTCRVKFNNLINFWGFSRIPTRNPFSSGVN